MKHIYTILHDDAAGINAFGFIICNLFTRTSQMESPQIRRTSKPHYGTSTQAVKPGTRLSITGKHTEEGGTIESGVDESMTTIRNVFELRAVEEKFGMKEVNGNNRSTIEF